MATYEAILLMKTLPKDKLGKGLKRLATMIFDRDGFIRKIYNLGFNETPYRIGNSGTSFKEANYFIIEFSAPRDAIKNLTEEYKHDFDVIYSKIYKKLQEEADHSACTLDEEMKPPAYRSEVIDMIEAAKARYIKKTKRVLKLNTNMSYYPFQR